MFADDTTIYIAGKSICEVKAKLEHELQVLVNWVEKNKLILNVDTTVSI